MFGQRYGVCPRFWRSTSGFTMFRLLVKIQWFRNLPCPEKKKRCAKIREDFLHRCESLQEPRDREFHGARAACMLCFRCTFQWLCQFERMPSCPKTFKFQYRRNVSKRHIDMFLFAFQKIVEDMGPPSIKDTKVSKIWVIVELFQVFLRPTPRKGLNGYAAWLWNWSHNMIILHAENHLITSTAKKKCFDF